MAECILAGGGGNSVGSDDCTGELKHVLRSLSDGSECKVIAKDTDDEVDRGGIYTYGVDATNTIAATSVSLQANQYLPQALVITAPVAGMVRRGSTVTVLYNNGEIMKVEGSLDDYNLDGDF